MSNFNLRPTPRYQPPVEKPEPEEFLGQIWVDNHWVDFARGTEESSRIWQADKPAERRLVDWVSGEVKVASLCPSVRTLPNNPRSTGMSVQHLDPHETTTNGVWVLTCGACGIRMTD